MVGDVFDVVLCPAGPIRQQRQDPEKEISMMQAHDETFRSSAA